MANSFSKEERVAFEDLLEGFQDALVMSKHVSIYRTNDTAMERQRNIIWRPQPYIAISYRGTDMTNNYVNYTQLAVPATLGYSDCVPWTMTATELRDALQENRLGTAARDKIASDINVSLIQVAGLTGTQVSKRTAPATGYDDVASCESIFNEQGVQFNDRAMVVATRDYNGMASNLAARAYLGKGTKPETAYEKSYIGEVASFDTFKADYGLRFVAAPATSVTVNGANQYYVPQAYSVATTGEVSNVDNRFQNIQVTVGSGNINVGDCFTFAGVDSVHHITKMDTGQLKTFRVIGLVTGNGGTGTITISPPIISAQGGTAPEEQYQNCTATPANGAAITFLNTASGYYNPFWQRDAMELLPGRYAVPENAGVAVLRASTDQGIELVMQKFYDIDTMITKYRIDALYGVCNKQPEMTGVLLFNQV
jgi:hypothetical protein